MKTLTSLIRIALGLLALAFTVSVAQASPDNKEAKEKGPSKEMLKKYDVNKDGKLDDAEMAAMKADNKAAALAKYDTNKNGKLDENEKTAMKADQEAAKAAKKAEHDAKKAGDGKEK